MLCESLIRLHHKSAREQCSFNILGSFSLNMSKQAVLTTQRLCCLINKFFSDFLDYIISAFINLFKPKLLSIEKSLVQSSPWDFIRFFQWCLILISVIQTSDKTIKPTFFKAVRRVCSHKTQCKNICNDRPIRAEVQWLTHTVLFLFRLHRDKGGVKLYWNGFG